MKENFFKTLKDNVKNAFSFQDDDGAVPDREILEGCGTVLTVMMAGCNSKRMDITG